jgi:hemerythrin-like domain-containing protein
LLNDDGSASMATALLMSHHAFRRDVARLGVALRGATSIDPAKVSGLQEAWTFLRNALHGHHTVEDTSMFPGMRAQHPELGPVFDRLAAEHHRIDPLLEAGDRAFADLAKAPAPAAAVTAELAALLDQHLTFEEANVVQFIREAKSFPPPGNDAEAEMYATGFAWSSHGIAPDVLAKVDEMLPASLTTRLAAARVAYDQQCARVWGAGPAGASRTSIPQLG